MSKSDFQQFISIGNLMRDPEMRPLGGDRFVCSLGLVTSHSYRNAAGETIVEPMPISVEAFGRVGEACAQFLRKGSQVFIEGHLSYKSWTDAKGEKKSRHVVVATTVRFLDHQRREDQPASQDGVGGEVAPDPLPASVSAQGVDDEPPF